MTNLAKRVKNSVGLHRASQIIYGWYIGLVLKTTRWTLVGFDQSEEDLANGIPRIFCFWHGRLALLPYFRNWQNDPISNFVSSHRDAQIATLKMEKMGIEVISVQTSGDKTGSVRAAVRRVRNGASLGITPDGPLGPRQKVQPGVLLIASLSQTRLSPVAFSTHRRIVLKTWDQFVVPLPFGRGVFVMADGDIPPRRMDDAKIAEMQIRLGEMIDTVSAEADRLVDQKPK